MITNLARNAHNGCPILSGKGWSGCRLSFQTDATSESIKKEQV